MRNILAFLMVVPTIALAQSHDARERDEVIKIFSLLIPKMDVKKGDGLGSDVDCVFAQKWDQSFHRNAEGEPIEQFYPLEQLTIQQALDPHGNHPKMFCNDIERNAEIQKSFKHNSKTVAVAIVGLSYPYFENNLDVATIYYQKWSQIFTSNDRKILPVGSHGVIKFQKHEGAWSFDLVSTGTVN